MALELDDLGGVVGGLQEVHLDVAADVGAFACAAAAAALAEEIAEEPFAEDIAEGGEDVADVVELRVRRRPPARRGRSGRRPPACPDG